MSTTRVPAGVPTSPTSAGASVSPRVPRGTPAGGQFAATVHAESGVALGCHPGDLPSRFADERDDETGMMQVYVDGEPVGYLTYIVGFGGESGTIDTVHVKPEYRRRGLARAMYDRLVESGFDLEHAAARTDAGEAWALSLGGPPREFRIDEDGDVTPAPAPPTAPHLADSRTWDYVDFPGSAS